jgi:hypothetical protein
MCEGHNASLQNNMIMFQSVFGSKETQDTYITWDSGSKFFYNII